MTLQNLRKLVRLYVPGAKTSVINNSTLDLLLNKAVREINIIGKVYRKNQKFAVVESQDNYDLTSVVSDFQLPDDSGLWWNDGTASSPDWVKLDPVDRNFMDKHFPTWRDDADSSPRRYFIENLTLTVHPAPNTALSEGFHLYMIRNTQDMTLSTHYPFTGSTTEFGAFRVFEDAILDYVTWKLGLPLGKLEKAQLSKKDFMETLNLALGLFNRRPDILASKAMRMRGPTIGR